MLLINNRCSLLHQVELTNLNKRERKRGKGKVLETDQA